MEYYSVLKRKEILIHATTWSFDMMKVAVHPLNDSCYPELVCVFMPHHPWAFG